MGEEIIKVLDALSEKLGIAIDYTSDNVIPYIQQLSEKLVNYELATSIMFVILNIIPVIVTLVLIKYIMKSVKNGTYTIKGSEFTVYEVATILAAVLSFLCIFFTINIIFEAIDIITCITFPEKIIFEYVTEVLQSMQTQ